MVITLVLAVIWSIPTCKGFGVHYPYIPAVSCLLTGHQALPRFMPQLIYWTRATLSSKQDSHIPRLFTVYNLGFYSRGLFHLRHSHGGRK